MHLFKREEVIECWEKFTPVQRDALMQICIPQEQEWIKEHVKGLEEKTRRNIPTPQ